MDIISNIRNYFSQYSKSEIKAVTSLSKKDTYIITSLVNEFKDKTRADIAQWREALEAADNPEDPRWVLLQDLYDNLETDGHFKSVKALRRAAVLSKQFFIRDKDGTEDIDKTKLLKKKWFFDMLKQLLDSLYKGYTVLELQDADTMKWKLIPRRNIEPTNERVYFEAMGENYVTYTDPAFAKHIIQMVNIEKFGLMNDIVPQLIWKRNAQQVWADFSESFGIPLVTAETMKTKKEDLDKIEEMLSQLGQAAMAVLPTGTNVTIHDSATKGDPYKVFQEQIKTTNEEISKRVVGGTMLVDDGSSRSQSEVHESNLDKKIAYEDKIEIQFIVNDVILPLLKEYGYPFDETDEFIFDDSEDIGLVELWKIINEANNWYEIPEEFVSRKFKIPIDGKKVNDTVTKTGMTANFR